MTGNISAKIVFILVEPIYAGNVGAVARILNNFGFDQLRLVGSIPEKNDYYLAVHSEQLIDQAQVYPDLAAAVQDLDRVIAFSRRRGRQKPVDLNPWNMAEYCHSQPELTIGLVFGRETYGLTDAEVDLCPLRCHIPANPAFPSLNLAQAVAVAAWEIWSYPGRQGLWDDSVLRDGSSAKGLSSPAVDGNELKRIHHYMLEVLQSIGYFQERETTNWDRFLAKLLHQLNPNKTMVYRLRQMFNRIHVLVRGRGKGF